MTKENAVQDFLDTLLSVAESLADDKVFKEELDNCKSVDDLLKDMTNKEKFSERLKKVSDMMNKEIEKSVEKVNNKERKVLIDRPMKTETKCDCGCGKTVEDCDCEPCKEENEPKFKQLNVPNAFTSVSIKPAITKTEPEVRLINVNKTAEKILAIIFDEIKEHCHDEEKVLYFDFMDEMWDEYLLNVRYVTIEKLIDRMADYLDDKGFNVATTFIYNDDGSADEMVLSVRW